ncbi:DASH family cryptochrome [Bombardia bombarda]|uniref:Cryptochrome DASH n=1 Tax=Bombardia bombarda TaxID=252184 RepID=A0AA39X6J1_9PEZI|nr:DASH family cryptochrome [Bombardia bombarda]
MTDSNIVVYLVRGDLRVGDNPITHELATSPDHGFTHALPTYIIPANQVEVSGLIQDGSESPFPEARSLVGGYWRNGPHRVKFLAESVSNLKTSLEALGSGLAIRVGMVGDVVRNLVSGLTDQNQKVGAVWMVDLEGSEEKRDQEAVASFCKQAGMDFKLWTDEKYFIDDRDVGLKSHKDVPDVFTDYRKSKEPLRELPRAVLPTPEKGSLPPFPDNSVIPGQSPPFVIPETRQELIEALVKPVKNFLEALPEFPERATSAHPFEGGETAAHDRLNHLILSDGMKNYKNTRNGLIGTEFSTKLSAFLALGCITARQIHHALLGYEDGTNTAFKDADGYGAGESEGTAGIRFELLWRDYMRLCHQKFGDKIFRLQGFKSYVDEKKPKWKFPVKENAEPDQDPDPDTISKMLSRFVAGTTGMGLIDASQRELIHTGYTSNRARQNVASFFAKHLGIDWRYGAEWYEMLLVDYDVSSNWANWQYVAGVGNDPRGDLRIFNPVKQAFDYDKDGSYVRSWVPELSKLEKLENVFQAWTASEEDLKAAGLQDNIMVTNPIKKIKFSVEGKPVKLSKRPFFRRRGQQGRGAGPVSPGGSEGKDGVGGGSDDGQGHNNHHETSGGGGEKTQRIPYRTNDRGGSPRGGGRGGGGSSSYRGGQRGYLSGSGGGRGGGQGRPRGGGGGRFGGPPATIQAGGQQPQQNHAQLQTDV